MAGPIESRGQLSEFLEILRRRRWQVLLPAVFVLAFGTAFAVIVPKKYLVHTQVELRPVSVSVSSKDGANATFQIRARERIRKVVGDLKNETYLTSTLEQRNDFVNDVQNGVRVNPVRAGDGETTFINIDYASMDVVWATSFLKALRNDWINDVLERDRNKLRDEKAKLGEEKHKLEGELLREEEAITDLKRRNGLSSTQPIPGGEGTRLEDPTYERLHANQNQLDAIEFELAKNRAELLKLRQRYDELPAEVTAEQQLLAGSSNEAELKELGLAIVDLKAKIDGYRPEHPKYKQLSKELQALIDKRDQTALVVTRTDVVALRKPNPERAPLLTQIEALELKIDTQEVSQKLLHGLVEADEQRTEVLHSVYEELRVRDFKAARLKIVLTDTEQALNAKSQKLEAVEGPGGNPFSITEEVIPPAHPTEPNPLMIVGFSLVAGLAAGLALALGLEFSKSSFRNVQEITRVMVVPVLGSVNRIVTLRELRLASGRRLVIGLSSILLIGSLAFVTWAWAQSPELLSSGLRAKIELLRARFR